MMEYDAVMKSKLRRQPVIRENLTDVMVEETSQRTQQRLCGLTDVRCEVRETHL